MVVSTVVGLVLLLHAPCPTAPSVAGCIDTTQPTPVVWVRPGLSRWSRHFVFKHEVGHLVCQRTPGCPLGSEKFANQWASCHLPWSVSSRVIGGQHLSASACRRLR